jgi:apolipoprotein D and lipocalin family protein
VPGPPKFAWTAAAAIVLTGATAALAEAPQPKRSFDSAHMKGRWYEIARSPNRVNQDCQAGTTDWTPKGDGAYRISAACHKGSPTASPRVIIGEVVVLNPGQNNKVRMKVFGGIIQRDYWIFDHAADYGWLIMGSPKGDFVSIEATRPILAPAVKAEALARTKALGFDTSALVFPAQLAK